MKLTHNSRTYEEFSIRARSKESRFNGQNRFVNVELVPLALDNEVAVKTAFEKHKPLLCSEADHDTDIGVRVGCESLSELKRSLSGDGRPSLSNGRGQLAVPRPDCGCLHPHAAVAARKSKSTTIAGALNRSCLIDVLIVTY